MSALECWLFFITGVGGYNIITIKPRAIWYRDWKSTVWVLDDTVFYLLGLLPVPFRSCGKDRIQTSY